MPEIPGRRVPIICSPENEAKCVWGFEGAKRSVSSFSRLFQWVLSFSTTISRSSVCMCAHCTRVSVPCLPFLWVVLKRMYVLGVILCTSTELSDSTRIHKADAPARDRWMDGWNARNTTHVGRMVYFLPASLFRTNCPIKWELTALKGSWAQCAKRYLWTSSQLFHQGSQLSDQRVTASSCWLEWDLQRQEQ